MLSKRINIIKERINHKKVKEKNTQMLESIHKAQKEWLEKENYFNFATDPDLVDFAIYEIEASKRKYAYLLKLAKEKNK